MKFFLLFVVAMASVACSSKVVIASDAAVEEDASLDAAETSDATLDAATNPDSGVDAALTCPVLSPGVGATCTGKTRCAYGTSPDPHCRFELECTSKGKWDTADNGECGWITCPTAIPSSSDKCTDSLATEGGCWWADGTYCACGYGGNWKCYSATNTAGCPKTVPFEGSACPKEGQTCNYCGHYESVCTNNAWHSSYGGRNCPMP